MDFGDRVPQGVGIDIEAVARWRNPDLRWESLFTEEELTYCRSKGDPALHLAGFWSLKEAVFKAVSGTLTVSLRDVSVHHREDGAPRVELKGYDDQLNERILVSVSHSPESVVAIAVFVAA